MEFKFIAPKRPSMDDVLLHDVRDRGLPADDLDWFVRAFVAEAKLTASEATLQAFAARQRWTDDEHLEEPLHRWNYLLDRLVVVRRASDNLADLMLDLMSPLWWSGVREKSQTLKDGSAEVPLITDGIAHAALAECKRLKLDLTAAASKESNTDEVRRLTALLDKEGLVDATKVVANSIPKLIKFADAKSLFDGKQLLQGTPEEQRAVEYPLYWLKNDPERFGRAFLPWLERLEPAERGRWSCAICAAFSAANEWVRSHDVWFGNPPRNKPRLLRFPVDAPGSRYEALKPSLELIRAVFDRLEQWRKATKAPSTWEEARAWMACFWMRASGDTPEWLESMLPTAGAFGLGQLGRMRPIVRRCTERPASDPPIGWSEYLTHCLEAVEESGLWWDALERLLLLFRELRSPAVLSDLRYWHKRASDDQREGSLPPKQPPKYWSLIPRLIARTIHGAALHYKESDDSLTELRTRFAEFCVNRISSRKGSNVPAETDPYWRAAYIGALGELYSNPSGRGHQAIYTMILERESEEKDVKEIAKSVYEDLRHARQLPNQVSARMAIFSAFVWLRQAHLITTAGCQPSEDLNVTLVQEVRRTTEPLTPQEVE